jgi:hypothetical protein
MEADETYVRNKSVPVPLFVPLFCPAFRAAICVAQFMKQPNHEEKLKEFEGLSRWGRTRIDFIEQGGWNKMPGQEEAGPAVAQACSEGLELLAAK